MTDKEPVYGVGDVPPVDYIEECRTRHGSQKIRNAFMTIRNNYEQINHDDERERIEEAIETIDECMSHNMERVMDELYPNSRAMHALEEGDLHSVSVREGTFALDYRTLEVEMEILLPRE